MKSIKSINIQHKQTLTRKPSLLEIKEDKTEIIKCQQSTQVTRENNEQNGATSAQVPAVGHVKGNEALVDLSLKGNIILSF